MRKGVIEVGWRKKEQTGEDSGKVTFSHFVCNSPTKSIYSEGREARSLPSGLQCPGAFCVLSNKNSKSSVIEKTWKLLDTLKMW